MEINLSGGRGCRHCNLQPLTKLPINEIVLDEIRRGCPTLLRFRVVFDPCFEPVRHIGNGVLCLLVLVCRAAQCRFEVAQFVFVKCFFIHQDGRGVTHTLRMPTLELECLGVTSNQFFANVAFAQRFVVAPVYFKADHEIQRLPTLPIAFPVSHIDFRPGKAHRVFVR